MYNQRLVESFHDKFRLPIRKKGSIPSPNTALLRARLIMEEAAEVVEALQRADYVGLAKELADLLYVVYGTAVEAGIPLDEVFAEVHRSNMTKSQSKDSGGKIMKGNDFEPADIEGVLNNA